MRQTTCLKKDGDKRHAKWLEAINDGVFSFGPEKLIYVGKGKGSWKLKALGTSFDQRVTSDKKDFLKNDWNNVS